MNLSVRALTACVCLFVAPDILPDDAKGIKSSNRIELGVIADHVFVQYAVAKGDTLTSIARTRLGEASRTPDVIAANPGIDADHLRIGQLVWLPPKDASTKDPVYVYLSWSFQGLAPLVPTAPLPYSHHGSYLLFLVPAAQHGEWLKNTRQGNWQQPAEAMVTAKQVEALQGTSAGQYVPTNSPIERAEGTLLVEKDKDGKLSIRQTVAHFDKDGKRIEAPKAEAGEVPPAPKKEALLLVFAFGGGAWLLLRARQQRLAPAPA